MTERRAASLRAMTVAERRRDAVGGDGRKDWV